MKDWFESYQDTRGEARNGRLDEIKCCGNVVPLEIGKNVNIPLKKGTPSSSLYGLL